MRKSIQERNDALQRKLAENKAAKERASAKIEELKEKIAKREAILRQQAAEQPEVVANENIPSKVEQLAQMLKKGYLTKEEYESKRAELLRRL